MRLLLLALLGCTPRPVATPTTKPGCDKPELRAFDFLLGSWRGTERDATGKIVSTSRVRNESVLGGCAVRETWHVDADGKRLFDALLLRSFDAGSKRWLLSYVDDALHHQLYEAREDGGHWRFLRERKADDGSTVLVRITWRLDAARIVQSIERSTDAGTTWTTGATITYMRE